MSVSRRVQTSLDQSQETRGWPPAKPLRSRASPSAWCASPNLVPSRSCVADTLSVKDALNNGTPRARLERTLRVRSVAGPCIGEASTPLRRRGTMRPTRISAPKCLVRRSMSASRRRGTLQTISRLNGARGYSGT